MSEDIVPPPHGDQPADTGQPEAADPASSLRAAALLTLKSKRRKQAPEGQSRPDLSIRTQPETSLQLDYGQDDIVPSPAAPPAAEAPEMEDGQIREEGEISDSEEAPTAKPAKASPLPIPVRRPRTPTSPRRKSGNATPAASSRLGSPATRTSDTLESRYSFPPTHPASTPGPSTASSVSVHFDRYLEVPLIDHQHVRPNLEINQENYDLAKDMILDLLGWGVPSEYLVNCGLSREIVYYVFNELNLRLPHNLDTTGIVPYPPKGYLVTIMSHDPYPPQDSSYRSTSTHPSLPAKPAFNPTNLSPRPSTPSAGISLSGGSTETLNDMERQRRQELLARKAVQASRKPKSISDSSSIASSRVAANEQQNSEDVEMPPAVAPETVNDFLDSIGTSTDLGGVDDTNGDDAMDIDSIPGLNGAQDQHSSSDMLVDEMTFASSSKVESWQRDNELVNIDFDQMSRQRRGTKRPVAADFVDSEGTHRQNGNGVARAAQYRRMPGGFASVSAMRRCVIDLSDSEGEGEDQPSDLPMPAMEDDIPPSRASAGSARPNSPSTLEEKEREILKMKQLIAEREQSSRARKLMRMGSIMTGKDSPRVEHATIKKEETTPSLSPVDQNPDPQDVAMKSADPLPPAERASSIASSGDENEETTTLSEQAVEETRSVLPSEEPNTAVEAEAEESNGDVAAELNGVPVGVDSETSSSAQLQPSRQRPDASPPENDNNDSFKPYTSLFSSFPLLRSHPISNLISSHIPRLASLHVDIVDISSIDPPSSSHSTLDSFLFSDLQTFRKASIAKRLDPLKTICKFEIAGGVCRDASCQDIHFSRLDDPKIQDRQSIEPDDHDTADFLVAILPRQWVETLESGNVPAANKIADALKQVDVGSPSLNLEERVTKALVSLGFPPQAT